MADQSRSNLLTKLPSEIRNKIWINVLSSPTGYVKLGPKRHFRSETLCVFEALNNSPPNQAVTWDYFGTVDISLTRTCIQIYEETEGMFWRHNTLVLHPMPRGFISQHSYTLEEELMKVMHVRFEIDFCSTNQWDTEQTFKMLGQWAKEGDLKTLEVCSTQGLTNFLETVDNKNRKRNDGARDLFQEYIWILRKAGGENGYLAGLNRKISINTGWQGESFEVGKQKLRYGRPFKSSFQGVLNTLKEIHDAFGGDLWQDGKLCYKDCVQVGQPFQLQE